MDWIFEILLDIAGFSKRHGLQNFESQILYAASILRQEIEDPADQISKSVGSKPALLHLIWDSSAPDRNNL